ncbi:MAG: hypothetical protein H7Z74_17980 [Anaerolineae bacterium]|nr:hypothetical protein [Gemmatimonadaceae bacterium]
MQGLLPKEPFRADGYEVSGFAGNRDAMRATYHDAGGTSHRPSVSENA